MPGGRDQLGPLERLTRLLLALEAGQPGGRGADQLVAIGDYGAASDADAARQLHRDVGALQKIGWDIRNVAGAGEEAVYRLYARDTRLRVSLTAEHQVQLVRAALVAGDTAFGDHLGDPADVPADPGPVRSRDPHRPGHDALDKAAYAVENRCLLRFTYKQKPRVVHPHLVHPGASGWYVVGHEDATDDVDVTKRFVTDRMSDVSVDPPGTATIPADEPYDELNPITWHPDPAVDVVVETEPDHEPQVTAMLGEPVERTAQDGAVRLTVPVTHRAAFRARVYELGRRVRVIAPDEMRDEIVAELRRIVRPAG
ncbi:putative DNA-binding transcriptional regulator YafY [Haloactinopolyspora alba]|uniref:Putative DNA-binding transcriptional regulator YafY n=1 Tax=Haloactinopolyspora alba TaxID=648780 RepID=A0A2P8EG37_9ACTN|nr:WYL domain-containing protein [Haloactinopolyspora alba]PSL08429.1 putative DNA-binding transcriptional regulator YafY [Haloactinopolyspora alba]